MTDWFPTLARAAGIDSSHGYFAVQDGVDQWGAVNGNASAGTRDELILHFNMWEAGETRAGKTAFDDAKASLRVGPWKYIQNEVGDRAYKPSENCSQIRCGLTPLEHKRYLFNIVEDPRETNNLIDSRSDVADRLIAKLKTFYRFSEANVHSAWAPPQQEDAYPVWEDANFFVVPWVGNVSTWQANFERHAQGATTGGAASSAERTGTAGLGLGGGAAAPPARAEPAAVGVGGADAVSHG